MYLSTTQWQIAVPPLSPRFYKLCDGLRAITVPVGQIL
jgi:hypothetical protein